MDSWHELVERILRPARPNLERCLAERERHLETRRRSGDERDRAIAACEARIEAARSAIFAAQDGVVGTRITDLEREWRFLSRRDPDAGLMDLWARIAPPAWMDRKRWRDSAPDTRLDAAIALAADVQGVEAAEAAVSALFPGTRVRWDTTTRDFGEELPAFEGIAPSLRDRAAAVERDVHAAMILRFPERPNLARAVARAAFVDYVCRAGKLPNPVTPLRDLWRTGYVISSIDQRIVTLEIPAIDVQPRSRRTSGNEISVSL
jgi:hypothetical protein